MFDMAENSGSHKGSDLALSLVAIAIAFLLFLLDKTPFWTAVCLLALAAFLTHPVTQIPWIRNNKTRQATAVLSMLLGVVFLGLSVWPLPHGNNHSELLAKIPVLFSSLITTPWIQRCLLIALGMIILWVSQLTARSNRLSFKGEKRRRKAEEKGFLDFKMQVEEGIKEMSPVLGRITKIMAWVGSYMNGQTAKMPRWSALPARIQVKKIRGVALQLNKFSVRMDREGAKLKAIGDSLVEGIDGWVPWISRQADREGTSQVLRVLMTGLTNSMESTLQAIESYMITVQSVRGVSAEMNRAVAAHLESVKRVRDATASLISSCSDALRVLQTTGPRS